MECRDLLFAGVVFVDGDVVADRIRRPETDHRTRFEPLLLYDPIEQRERIIIECARSFALFRIVKDGREPSGQFP